MAFLIALMLQWGLDYELLAVEDARADWTPLVEALSSADVDRRWQAVRALGRLERPDLAKHVEPVLDAEDPNLRIEAANALAQMGAAAGRVRSRLALETNPRVRAALYEALGRMPGTSESVLVAGLAESATVRAGAVKGLEAFLRMRELRPSHTTTMALRKAVQESSSSRIRQLALLALNRAGDRDVTTLETAWRDREPLVRRLALIGLEEWRDDPAPMVRYAALRHAPSCVLAERALSDASEHVVLLAIDTLGDGCSAEKLRPLVEEHENWRRAARALVSLARTDPDAAREALPRFINHRVWQARVYAAKAAKILDETKTLASLRGDTHPNVVAEALVTPEHALAALESDDYGLLMTALDVLEGRTAPPGAVAAMKRTLRRVSSHERATSRDPRRRLLQRLSELGDVRDLDYLVRDFDPLIAATAAKLLDTSPETLRFAPSPLPSMEYLSGLVGATAHVNMREAGSFVIELLPTVAPLTSAQFAELAEAGYYDGLTFHRIVPNFVLQGGSPGANEFVGTPGYIRDEVGRSSHERGTLGISTRGRDTGDSQIFINLVDNYRLDHNYTVFARVVDGMDNVDQIQEGDVMETVRIVRR